MHFDIAIVKSWMLFSKCNGTKHSYCVFGCCDAGGGVMLGLFGHSLPLSAFTLDGGVC